jgi:hypothetical protein
MFKIKENLAIGNEEIPSQKEKKEVMKIHELQRKKGKLVRKSRNMYKTLRSKILDIGITWEIWDFFFARREIWVVN